MAHPDTRWIQRLASFRKALARLQEAADLAGQRPLTGLEQQGLIQAFEFTHELAWNMIKDWLEYQGHAPVQGSREAFREAFRLGLVTDGEVWMTMIASRNRSSHTYDEGIADAIGQQILTTFHPAFVALSATMQAKATP